MFGKYYRLYDCDTYNLKFITHLHICLLFHVSNYYPTTSEIVSKWLSVTNKHKCSRNSKCYGLILSVYLVGATWLCASRVYSNLKIFSLICISSKLPTFSNICQFPHLPEALLNLAWHRTILSL